MRRKNKGRGFKSLSDAERRLVASLGGKAAHTKGKRHVFTLLKKVRGRRDQAES